VKDKNYKKMTPFRVDTPIIYLKNHKNFFKKLDVHIWRIRPLRVCPKNILNGKIRYLYTWSKNDVISSVQKHFALGLG